ncbi:flagellar biosynthesis anti-sigma factor FlgM [Paludibacterium purpuratum]|uniref:Negative regulator of flagellin synthesis n=1 Tax=Paludibacterium purpuratum TaxID=1144873 RepID=A0A4R7B9G1_9NEIS|nr:flagellar biosynthesis anti-sigma factor FlgM [Paludibacterium purpuratum]TDR81458.1 FlgM family anti-sigma-28 factor [Paludibacterium purpuratum]
MKIDQSGNIQNLYPTQGKSAKRKNDTESTGGNAPSSQVAINPLASQINAVSQDMAAEPSFDVSKVEAIKSAIASGSFQINPENIADGLIASTKQLLAG